MGLTNSKSQPIEAYINAPQCAPNTVCNEIQKPFFDISSKVNTLVMNINAAIKARNEGSSTKDMFDNEIRAMRDSTNAHNVLFEEEEMKAQSKGKKTRRQTIQEFVLLFFFCGYAIFTAAITAYHYQESGMPGVKKSLPLLIVIGLVIGGLIIRLG